MSDATAQNANELWENWIKDRDNESANKLIKHYFYLVNYHVQRIALHLPSSVSKDDLKSLGLYGLYDALKKFEPKRDLKFDTYASFRIRGAIIDGLRKEDWLPRSIRDKAKKIEKVSQRLEQQLERQPTAEEIGMELGISSNEVEETVKDSLFAHMLSIEEKPSGKSDEYGEGIGYTLPDDSDYEPETNLVLTENYLELSSAIKKLNHKEQMVLSLFYNEELSLTEIGQVLELTTSRISQIHKQAIFKLKNYLSS